MSRSELRARDLVDRAQLQLKTRHFHRTSVFVRPYNGDGPRPRAWRSRCVLEGPSCVPADPPRTRATPPRRRPFGDDGSGQANTVTRQSAQMRGSSFPVIRINKAFIGRPRIVQSGSRPSRRAQQPALQPQPRHRLEAFVAPNDAPQGMRCANIAMSLPGPATAPFAFLPGVWRHAGKGVSAEPAALLFPPRCYGPASICVYASCRLRSVMRKIPLPVVR
jgi:hypothetical protein